MPEVIEQVVEEVEEIKAPVIDSPRVIKKLIRNPLRLTLSIVLQDFKPYTLLKAQLEDEIFMEHIDKLLSQKKIKKV